MKVGGRQMRTLTGHTSTVFSVAFSRDGTRIVSGSFDRSVKIWDAETGAEVSSFVCGRALRVARWPFLLLGRAPQVLI